MKVEEQAIISYISRNYSNSHIKKEIYSKNKYIANKHNEDAIYQYAEYILEVLGVEYSRIILYEYLLKDKSTNIDKEWYLEYYSASTYRRLKKEAMKRFISCIQL